MVVRRSIVVAALVGIALSVVSLGVAIQAAALGHGTYLPAILLFPWSMALSALAGSIAIPLIILAVVQFPAYGVMIGMTDGSQQRRAVGLLVAHVLAAGVAFVLARATGTFFP